MATSQWIRSAWGPVKPSSLYSAISRSRLAGFTRSTVNAEDPRQFFIEELIETLRGFSPQLIAYRRGTLATANASETFFANRGARNVVFKISWPHGQQLDLRIFKDEIDATASARVVAGKFYRIFVFDMPAKAGPGTLAGDWRIALTGEPGVAYEAAGIVDEPAMQYWVCAAAAGGAGFGRQTPGRRHGNGDCRDCTAACRHRQSAGAGRRRRQGTTGCDAGHDRGRTPLGRARKRKPGRYWCRSGKSFVCRAARDRAAIPNVTVPGLYRVTVRVLGEDIELGRFERSATTTAVVRFGPADRRRSQITLVTPTDKDAALSVRPRPPREPART
jgi:hypothetical protein